MKDKRVHFLIYITIFSGGATQAQIDPTLLKYKDTTRIELWQKWKDGSYVNDKQSVFVFDSKMNLVTTLDQVWDGKIFVNTHEQILTYDNKGKLKNNIDCKISNNYVEQNSYKFTYDDKGNLTSSLYEHWYGKMWVNTGKNEFVYDAKSRLTELVSLWWQPPPNTEYNKDGYNAELTNNSKQLYTYNDKGMIIEKLNQRWNGTEWEIPMRYTYDYDEKGNDTLEYSYAWVDLNWRIYTKKATTYNIRGNKTSEANDQFSTGGEWEGQLMSSTNFLYAYDNNGKKINEIYIGGGFKTQKIYTYDAKGNLNSIFVQKWRDSEWVNESKCQFIYRSNK